MHSWQLIKYVLRLPVLKQEYAIELREADANITHGICILLLQNKNLGLMLQLPVNFLIYIQFYDPLKCFFLNREKSD